jgi:hypothetical protein
LAVAGSGVLLWRLRLAGEELFNFPTALFQARREILTGREALRNILAELFFFS